MRGPRAPHRTVAPRAPTAPLDTTHTTPKPASIEEGPRVVGVGANPEHTSRHSLPRPETHERELGGEAARNDTRRQQLRRCIALDTEVLASPVGAVPGPSVGRQTFRSAENLRESVRAFFLVKRHKSLPACMPNRGGADESACKPGSVPGRLTALRSATIHLGLPLPTGSCGLPAGSGGPPSNACAAARLAPRGLLTLLRVGFTEPPRSPGALVVSYTTVSPLPRAGCAGRSVFCGTVPRVTPGCR